MRERVTALIVLFFAIVSIAGDFIIVDGKVVFPESDISETASFYKVKDVEFFVVKKGDGTIVSHKNACQACGPVGFVQNGTAMKCNGCGLEYEIDILGVDNPGSCWPFYVANSVNDPNVEITLSALGLDDTPIVQSQYVNAQLKVLALSPQAIFLQLPQSGDFSVVITTLQGKTVLQQNITNNGESFKMPLPTLASGQYVLQV